MARTSKELVICVKNEGYSVSLERRKLYVALPDTKAAEHGQLRVIDESGQDYLYPREFFVAIELPQPPVVVCCKRPNLSHNADARRRAFARASVAG